MAFRTGCPACGAEVLFKSGSSIVVVCEFCHSVVARTDRGVEDVGKVADVVESGSPLEVGLRGAVRNVPFTLTGRAQLQHAAGGMWDEWYAAFEDGRWGWLAEAQGRFYLTFQIQVPDTSLLPPFDLLELGQPVRAIPSQNPPVIAEKGEARMLAAEGEIPYRLVPNEVYRYADLSGADGIFGTLDYGDQPPNIFVGREVTLADLSIAATGRTREREPRAVTASRLNCPQCAGPLELRAPDKAERVTCPNCGSLLDINQGELVYLKTLQFVGTRPDIAPGSVAEFEGQPFTVIGFMTRSVEFDGVRYYWQEYLLYNPMAGFRWLVQSDGHWSYVRPISPGEVNQLNGKAVFGGRKFKAFQDAAARVDYVAGEFYWKVTVGEMVRAVDFVSPPLMLSKEVSGGFGVGKNKGEIESEEINWSLGTYIPKKQVEEKFKIKLPSPNTVAPNQPYPNKSVYKYWLLLTALALFLGFVFLFVGSGKTVFTQTFRLDASPPPTPTPGPLPGEAPPAPGEEQANTQIIFTEPFQLRGGENVRVSGVANPQNNWLYVAGDLINEETLLVQQFDLPMESYSGVEDGESWSEGSSSKEVTISALPAGTYTMRLEAQYEKWTQPSPPEFTIKVEQGVVNGFNFVLLLIFLAIPPIIIAWRHFSFERRRWADSAFNPYESSGDSDDE
jgi:hypothetical protein